MAIKNQYKRDTTDKQFDHADFRNSIWGKTSGLCWYCGINMLPFGKSSISFSIDHIEPVRWGGTNEFSNLAPSCGKCNSQKNQKTLEVYRKWIGKNHVFWFEQKGLIP